MLDELSTVQEMEGKLAVLVDDDAQMTVEEAATALDRFVPGQGPVNAGFTRAAYWLAFRAETSAQSAITEWLMEVSIAILDYVDVYVARPEGGFTVMRQGDRRPFAERPVPHRTFVFPLDIPRGETRLILMRVQTSSAMSIRTKLWRPSAFASSAVSEERRMGLLYGAAAVVCFVAIHLWRALGERLYLWFLAHTLSMIALHLGFNGHMSMLLSPWPRLADGMLGFSFSIKTVTVSMLALHIMRLSFRAPHVARFYRSVAILGGMLSATAPLDVWGQVGPIVNGLTLILAITTLALAMLWAYRGDFLARIVVISLSPTVVMGCLLIGRNLGMLRITSDVIDWGIQIGLVFHLMVLAYGLTQRMLMDRQENQRLQTALLEASRMEETRLTDLVAERTAELVESRGQIQAALETEQRVARDQRAFLSMVAHEFRGPLQNIDASATVVGLCLSPDDDEGHGEIDSLHHGVARLSGLVDTFLADGWLDSTAVNPVFTPVDLTGLIKDISTQWQREHSKQTMICKITTDSARVLADKVLLRTAISNILENAVKYSPSDSTVQLSLHVAQDQACVTVTDQGIGIAPQDQPHIFDRFYRSSRNMEISGSGLGLHIVRKIAQAHYGEVAVISEMGQGSSFTITLPLILD